MFRGILLRQGRYVVRGNRVGPQNSGNLVGAIHVSSLLDQLYLAVSGDYFPDDNGLLAL